MISTPTSSMSSSSNKAFNCCCLFSDSWWYAMGSHRAAAKSVDKMALVILNKFLISFEIASYTFILIYPLTLLDDCCYCRQYTSKFNTMSKLTPFYSYGHSPY